jgi:hypothetical protein
MMVHSTRIKATWEHRTKLGRKRAMAVMITKPRKD